MRAPRDGSGGYQRAHDQAGAERAARAAAQGGDPFVFGRGGEELTELARHGVRFQVAPGITSATGCAAYAGIPLTHRDHAQACVFVTGHGSDGRLDLDWRGLARPSQTVVVYMGLRNAAAISRMLIAHGAPPSRPVAIVSDGTRAGQRTMATRLATLADAVRTVPDGAAALIVIGDVVRLAASLSWFVPHGAGQAAEALPATLTA